MADETEPSGGRKRRIIHWNPEAGSGPVKRRWTWQSILAWTAGGFVGLFLLAAVTIRVTKAVFGPEIFGGGPAATGDALAPSDPSLAFVSRSKAELARETANRALNELRRSPQDHQTLLQQLVNLQRAYLGGETLINSGEYGKAFAHYEELNRQIERFSTAVKTKQEAQEAYDAILVKIRELDRARSLAPELLDAAFTLAGTGQGFLATGSFEAAKSSFKQGFVELTKAENLLDEFVQTNLMAGQEALSRGDRAGATAAFRATLEKAPGNEVALQGMARAETIDQVFALIRQARNFESQGKYVEAADAFGRAFALDKFSASAQQGQARALRLDQETRFNSAFEKAEAAFKQRDWPVAIAGYEAALEVYPDKQDVRDQLKAAKDNAHADAVQTALAKAFDHENRYEWAAARVAYDKTLQLDPNHAEAKEGYARSGRIIRALIEYDKLIEVAEERASRAEFQSAIRTFNEAMAVKPSYLANSERVNQLHQLLMSQSQPVDVTFASDGKTWVSISTYRLLGQITSQTVKILPGDYEIIGRRKGYQDVQLILQVRNGTPPPTVSVVCKLRNDR